MPRTDGTENHIKSLELIVNQRDSHRPGSQFCVIMKTSFIRIGNLVGTLAALSGTVLGRPTAVSINRNGIKSGRPCPRLVNPFQIGLREIDYPQSINQEFLVGNLTPARFFVTGLRVGRKRNFGDIKSVINGIIVPPECGTGVDNDRLRCICDGRKFFFRAGPSVFKRKSLFPCLRLIRNPGRSACFFGINRSINPSFGSDCRITVRRFVGNGDCHPVGTCRYGIFRFRYRSGNTVSILKCRFGDGCKSL